MHLKLTNTLSGKLESFFTINPNTVLMYCCGVTVYDLCHLGHARSYVNWDVLRRHLIDQKYKVVFVQNFTDIDDKILAKASSLNISMEEVSERNIKDFHIDMDSLNILRPDKMPRATKCIHEIKEFISNLEEKDFAYNVNGDVYF